MLVLGLGLGVLAWVATLVLDSLPDQRRVGWGPADRASSQRKVATALAVRRGGPSEVVFTEPELTALLARYLEEAGQPVADLAVRLLGPGRLAVGGGLPAGRMAREVGLGGAFDLLPRRWSERPVWIHLELRERTIRDGHRRVRLEPGRLYVGRLRAPGWLHRVILSPSVVGLLEWNVPATVDTVSIERGRLVVRLAG